MTTKIALTNIADTALATLTGPKITTIVYPGDDTATDVAGGQTINLTGNGFQSGCSVLVASTASSVVTFISATQISFLAPALSAGTYVIYVINPDGGTAISIPGISYSGTPNWSTSAGTLGTVYETGSISATLTATGDAPITYTLATGTLPPGSSLNSNGTLSGTAQATGSATTYNFTIKASDAQNQDTNRAFSITINPDVVTWSSPASLATYNVNTNTPIANVTMSATSAAGGSITYTADTLPTGLSITGANIAGTPTVVASTTTVLTATATSTRTATRTINWVVTVANDTYWKNTTLLLNGETTVTPFISDASSNSFGLTINGDTKPVLFNPYQGGYYSNYFNGSSDYLVVTYNSSFAIGSNDFTIEMWLNFGAVGNQPLVGSLASNGTGAGWELLYNFSVTAFRFFFNNAYITFNSFTPTIGTWYHVALTRVSTNAILYINGVSYGTQALSASIAWSSGNMLIGAFTDLTVGWFNGYISNLRVVNGTAVYTSAFTPSTTPLTAITNTSLLTNQSNRFIDKSTNALAITINGSPQISPNIPFTANSSYSTYGSTYFDGSGDYLLPPDSSLNLSTSSWCIEYWMYPTTISSGYYGLWACNSSTGFRQGIYTDSGTHYIVVLNGGGGYGGMVLTAANKVITTNTWFHVALACDGTTIRQFVNGALTTTGSASTFASSGPSIGSWATTNYFNGYMSDFRVVKGTAVYTTTFTPPTSPLTAITNTSLLTLQYNGGATNQAIIDNSNFNNIITRAGNTSQGTFSPYSQTGWSTYFNGTNDNVTIASNTSLNIEAVDFTIEAWIYMNVMPTATSTTGWGSDYDSWFVIYERSAGGTTGWQFRVGATLLTLGGTGDSSICWGTHGMSAGTWYHVAVSRQSGTYKLFVNGTSLSLTTQAVSMATSGAYYIGSEDTSGANFKGYISNLRVIKGTALYTAGFTPPTSPLTPTTDTVLLTCQSNRLVDNSSSLNTISRTGTNTSIQAYSPFGSIREAVPISYSTSFTGSNTDSLSIADNDKLDAFTDFTIECWVYFTSVSGGVVLAKGWDAGSLFAPYLIYINGGDLSFTGTSASGSWDQLNKVIISSVAVNTWYHVAVTRSGSSLKLFSNGALITTISYGTTLMNSTSAFTIGSAGAGYNPMTGYVSNVRIIKGTALYTSAFTPSTTPLTTTSQGATASQVSFLGCQNTTQLDNSSNAFAVSQTGSPKIYKFNPFGYTAQSVVSYTPSLHGGSVYFDGTSDYLTLANNTAWSSLSGDFTIECWFYFMNSTQQQQVLFTQRSSSTQYVPYLFWTTNATIVMYSSSDNGSWNIINNTTVVSSWTPQTWNHFAFTRSGSTNRIFFNGVQTYTYTNSSSFTNSGTFNLGMSPGETNAAAYGYIADARLTKTAIYTSNFVPPTQPLTNYSASVPSALLLNFTNGGIVDQHGSNVLENVGNAQLSTAVKKYNNSSIYFDGTGDYLSMPSNQLMNFGTGDFTVEAWVYPNSLSSDWFIITASGSGGFFIGYSSTTTLGYGWGRVGTAWDYRVASTATTGAWQHVAVTRSGTSMRLFVNGTQAGTTQTISTSYDMSTTSTTVGSQGANYYLNGYIDDLRITKGYARYTSNFTAPTSALITK